MSVITSDDAQARAVAERLLGIADDEGRARISRAALAAGTGLAARALGRVLSRLEGAGWIEVEEAGRGTRPAVYNVAGLAREARASGLVARVPEPEPAVASEGDACAIRVLDEEEATAPVGRVEAGHRYFVAPGLLQVSANIRASLRVTDAFTDSVRDLGVLKDIDVYPSLTGLVILDGHRRVTAAIAAGRDLVPVRVVDVVGGAERIGLQLVENDAHERMTAVERAQAIEQMCLLGLSQKDLRAYGVRRFEAGPAKKVAAASERVQALEGDAGLDMIALAKVSELEEIASPEVMATVVKQVSEEPWRVDHIVEVWMRQARMDRAVDVKTLELRQQGVRVLPKREVDRGYPKTVLPLWRLRDAHGLELAPEAHASCPGHVAVVECRDCGFGRDAEEPTAQVDFYCVGFADHGHFDSLSSNGPTTSSARSSRPADAGAGDSDAGDWEDGADEDNGDWEREEAIADAKAAQADAEAAVRRRWVRDVLLAKPPKRTALFEFPIMAALVSWMSASEVKEGVELLGLVDDQLAQPRTEREAARARLLWTCAQMETTLEWHDWYRDPEPCALHAAARLYLRSLENWGYALGEGEQEFCEQVEALEDCSQFELPERIGGAL